jgi:hypothetical protein
MAPRRALAAAASGAILRVSAAEMCSVPADD